MATPTEVAAPEPDLTYPPTIVTATRLEYLVTRLAARRCRVVHAGMRLQRLADALATSRSVILSGLAGSLVPELTPGTVIVPSRVSDVDGNQFDCDPRLVERLKRSAIGLDYQPVDGLLLTASHIVTGDERAFWAERGFVAADMEAAMLARRDVPFAVVRVILDSPSRSLASAWERPASALLRRAGWREAGWLATAAPHYTLRAARIAAITAAAPCPSSRAKR